MSHKAKFQLGELVKHVASNKVYQITREPTFKCKLEYCNEQYYEYVGTQDTTKWIRCVSEMEDGRFVKL